MNLSSRWGRKAPRGPGHQSLAPSGNVCNRARRLALNLGARANGMCGCRLPQEDGPEMETSLPLATVSMPFPFRCWGETGLPGRLGHDGVRRWEFARHAETVENPSLPSNEGFCPPAVRKHVDRDLENARCSPSRHPEKHLKNDLPSNRPICYNIFHAPRDPLSRKGPWPKGY